MSGHICHYDGGKPMLVLPIHRRRNTLETVVVLRGRVVEDYYDDAGVLVESFVLGDCHVADAPRNDVPGKHTICSLIKTLCDDERTIMNLRYHLIAHDRVYHFNDTDIHNNPFDV